MTLANHTSLMSTRCACGADKFKKESFCRDCYKKLTGKQKMQLIRKGPKYDAVYGECLDRMGL